MSSSFFHEFLCLLYYDVISITRLFPCTTDICNRYGHSASYHTTAELENEIALEATRNNMMTSDGMSLSPSSSTEVAFDNFDRFVYTLSGKDTLHDTVGIAYQTVHHDHYIDVTQGENLSQNNPTFCGQSQKQRKRA